MNQLTIEHLSPYLPHDLQLHDDYDNLIVTLIGLDRGGVYIHRRPDLKIKATWEIEYKEIKPLLRPLSDLTKEINHRGETFVPDKKIVELYPNSPNWEYIRKVYTGLDVSETNIEQCVFQKLCEWQFDVFGLIESGLAISVHDLEFNPYEK